MDQTVADQQQALDMYMQKHESDLNQFYEQFLGDLQLLLTDKALDVLLSLWNGLP